MIAALFVQADGCYFALPGVDPWDISRDARSYVGSSPVVAHPPCERWGRYWGGGPMLANTDQEKTLGDDDGCFASALAAVRRCGGVIEHPQATRAWAWHGLTKPPHSGGWVYADQVGGFTCCVEQGHYGHRARKATWLYVFGMKREDLPELRWGASESRHRFDDGFHSREERQCARPGAKGVRERLSKRERAATPVAFRDILISIAERCGNAPREP